MALNLGKRLIEFLQLTPDSAHTAREIAEWVFEQFPKECAEKKAASTASYLKTDADLVQQLVAEISGSRPRWQKQYAQLKTTEGRPRRYYWTEKDASEEVISAEMDGTVAELRFDLPITAALSVLKISESDLYPILAKYLQIEHRIVSARIDEKRSSN